MEFTQVVKDRFSCKKFNDQKVEKEKLTAILEAGRVAPTAKNMQVQRIYVVESEELLHKIDELTPCRYNAPTVIVVCYDNRDLYHYPESDRDSGVEDATIVATHMVLAAYNEGVDACWVNRFNPAKMKEILALPEYEEVVMMMDVGYGDNAKALPNHFDRKELSETVKYL